jgi:two-component system OmpR family response regulator
LALQRAGQYLDSHIFLHLSFPTDEPNAVFFGPDTYRFADAVNDALGRRSRPIRQAVGIGCGSGAVGILVALAYPEARVSLTDINVATLAMAGVNARAAGATNTVCMESDVFQHAAGPSMCNPGANAPMPRILIVDDDPDIREVVLDVMLPELDGTNVCLALRRRPAEAGGGVPILFLSSRDEEVERLVGLEIGGNDYTAKPVSPRELVARIRALLRRPAYAAEVPAATSRALVHGRLRLDLDSLRIVWSAGADRHEIALSGTELGLLRTLMSRPGRVFSRDELMDRAYATSRVVSDRTIDSPIRRLRAKFTVIGAAPIETLPGFGYRLGPCD